MSYGLAASDRQWQWQWPDLYTFSNTDTNVELGQQLLCHGEWNANNTRCIRKHILSTDASGSAAPVEGVQVRLGSHFGSAIRFALHLVQIHPGMQEVVGNAKNGAPTCYVRIGYTYTRVYLFHWWKWATASK